MRNLGRHLSALKISHPEAYAAYVVMLVEDCTDEFEIDAGGQLHAVYTNDGTEYHQVWDPEPTGGWFVAEEKPAKRR